jgi:Ca2+-binding EF-hand superfamily protein
MDTDGSGEISLGGLKHVLLENAVSGSLGGLTEEEVEDIFNAMRVRKTETRFHWHEFIAAGLSHCRVDERNIRLAFDRLDSDHKGYITFEDVMDLMGNDASQSEDAMRRMWGDSMKDCDNHGDSRIGYDDFILLMKGQTRNPGGRGGGGGVTFGLGLGSLDPVSESISEQHSVDHSEETPVGSSVSLQDDVIVLPSGDIVCVADGTVVEQKEEGNASMGSGEGGVGGGPVSSGAEEPGASAALSEDIGLSFDEDEAEAEDEAISGAADKRIAAISDDNPPQTPKRGASDFNSPNTYKEKLSPVKPISSAKEGPLDIDRPDLGRRRSRSVDDQDRDQPSEGERGALSKEDSKPKLALNRELYRHHRQMRLAVLEASKRFEDQYLYHEMERLKAENAAGKKAPAAGLTMRHGLRELSTEAIQLVMLQQQKKQQQQVETATRRGGRGRRSRKKTVSDMSAMLASVPPVEMVMDPAPPFATANSESDKVSGGLSQSGIQSDSKQLYHLKPTTPGVFRKTIDPFSEMTGRIAGLKSQGQERRSNSMELASSAAIMNPSSGISTKIGKSPLAAANDKPTILASSSDGDLQKLEREGSDDRKQWPPPPPLS